MRRRPLAMSAEGGQLPSAALGGTLGLVWHHRAGCWGRAAHQGWRTGSECAMPSTSAVSTRCAARFTPPAERMVARRNCPRSLILGASRPRRHNASRLYAFSKVGSGPGSGCWCWFRFRHGGRGPEAPEACPRAAPLCAAAGFGDALASHALASIRTAGHTDGIAAHHWAAWLLCGGVLVGWGEHSTAHTRPSRDRDRSADSCSRLGATLSAVPGGLHVAARLQPPWARRESPDPNGTKEKGACG